MEEVTLKTIHKDLRTIRQDIQFIKHALAEDFELNKEAKKELEEARKTAKTEYVSQQEMEEEFLS